MEDDLSFLTKYRRGIGTSLRNNASAYGYSIVATGSFAALTHLESGPNLLEIFLFVGGAVAAFAIFESAASKLFREKLSGEPARVIALGTAFSFASISAGIGMASISGWLMNGWPVWPISGFAASSVYLLVVGLEMAFAESAEE